MYHPGGQKHSKKRCRSHFPQRWLNGKSARGALHRRTRFKFFCVAPCYITSCFFWSVLLPPAPQAPGYGRSGASRRFRGGGSEFTHIAPAVHSLTAAECTSIPFLFPLINGPQTCNPSLIFPEVIQNLGHFHTCGVGLHTRGLAADIPSVPMWRDAKPAPIHHSSQILRDKLMRHMRMYTHYASANFTTRSSSYCTGLGLRRFRRCCTAHHHSRPNSLNDVCCTRRSVKHCTPRQGIRHTPRLC